MRVWDQIPPSLLCRQHLLGEHREIHGIWTVVTEKRKGYAAHPETKRWLNHVDALAMRHDLLVKEMEKRGYHHRTPLDHPVVMRTDIETPEPIDDQWAILRAKGCDCQVPEEAEA